MKFNEKLQMLYLMISRDYKFIYGVDCHLTKQKSLSINKPRQSKMIKKKIPLKTNKISQPKKKYKKKSIQSQTMLLLFDKLISFMRDISSTQIPLSALIFPSSRSVFLLLFLDDMRFFSCDIYLLIHIARCVWQKIFIGI